MNRCNDILEYLILGLSVADSVFMLIIQIIFGTVWSQACRTGALLNFCHLLWVKPVDYFIKFLFSVPWDGILLFHSRKFKNKICYFRISYEKRVLTNLKFNKSAVCRHCNNGRIAKTLSAGMKIRWQNMRHLIQNLGLGHEHEHPVSHIYISMIDYHCST